LISFFSLEQKGIKDKDIYYSRMNALTKIATITTLVAEIGDCDEIQFSLNAFVKVLTDLKSAMNAPKCVVMKYQLDADGNRVGEGVPCPPTRLSNCDECETERICFSLKCAEHMKIQKEAREMARNDLDATAEPEPESEDEDDCYIACKCNNGMDIRGRCDPIRSAKQFSTCPARVDTAYFHINNDFEKYNDIQASFTRADKHKKYYAYMREEPFFLKDHPSHSDSHLDELILELIEADEENEEQYLCCYCDTFVNLGDEEDQAEWNDDRLVCGDCVSDHKCEECSEFFDEDLEEVGDKLCCGDCGMYNKCDDLECEVKEEIGEMENNERKLEMLEKIKNIIAEYK